MRNAIDWFLTANLIGMLGYCSYLWYTDQLIIMFAEPQTATVVQQDVVQAFETTLKMEVDRRFGKPENGYQPYMFLDTFSGLAPTDFEGVEASIGYYTIQDGRLMHVIEETHLRHEAATAITKRGMSRLLDNITERTGINLRTTGTITEVMNAISD